jgi:hypothetical protein
LTTGSLRDRSSGTSPGIAGYVLLIAEKAR